MATVLLFATTTGYQTRAFGEAAERLGVELVFATDRCNVLEDPWRDGALPIRFSDEAAATAAIVDAAKARRFDGVLAVGDRPTVIAAGVAERLGLAWHPRSAAVAAGNKRLTRDRLQAAGLPVPWFVEHPLMIDPDSIARLPFPCVVKPIALSGSRGVMRVNDGQELRAAIARLRTLLESPDIRGERNPAHQRILIEGFIAGREYAIEGLMNHGTFDLLAIFDKPDPLDGPFFEESIYLTPSRGARALQRAIAAAVGDAAAALGLRHGPIHAECRAHEHGVFVLEVAARPIGGLCARALRFDRRQAARPGDPIALEELLLRHALGESSLSWTREVPASGVMMIPIPRRGVFRGVTGIEDANATALVTAVHITAKPDQLLLPLPEGASYLGFIFARGDDVTDVERALRAAHQRLAFTIEADLQMLQSAHG
ncbi:MAG: ATP-grasp domain-containing protein [Luteitalea sp.]|nr:ATP-grasp domain-containing protein [Luteitalea sp.]